MVSSLAFLRRRRDEATASAPVQPVVDSSQPDPEADESGDDERKVDRWWRVSSFELRRGLEVSEQDTVPAEFFDELFPEPSARSAPARR